jgi:hypothetical protein
MTSPLLLQSTDTELERNRDERASTDLHYCWRGSSALSPCDTSHLLFSQVGTPNFGNTQIWSANQKTRNPIISSKSLIF